LYPAIHNMDEIMIVQSGKGMKKELHLLDERD
jgi:hypothetical protein